MPSLLHESLVELFRLRPLLAGELLEAAHVLEPGSVVEGRLAESDLSQVVPPEFRADAVVHLIGKVNLSAVIEVQLRIEPGKRWTWPAYLAVQRARERCDVVVLVLTLDGATARWARCPIGLGPGSVVRPIVFGPEEVPVVTDPEVALASPEVAVLSAMAHGCGPVGVEIGRAALEATRGLDEARSRLYVDLVFQSLPHAARSLLESLMIPNWQPQSDFMRRVDAQNRQWGVEEGQRKLVLRQLTRRFGALPEHVCARVGEASEAELERWGEELLVADSLEAIFGSEVQIR